MGFSDNPYQAPQTLARAESSQDPHRYRFVRLRPLFKTLQVFILIDLVCEFLLSIVDSATNFLFPNLNDPNSVLSDQEWQVTLGIGALVSIVSVFVLIAIIYVCLFMYRSNSNLRSLGISEMKHTPTSCVVWWFIPIANLFKPFQCLKEIFILSQTKAGHEEIRNMHLVAIWWTCWVLCAVIGWFDMIISSVSNIGPVNYLVLSMASSLFYIGAGVHLLKILKLITDWQDTLSEGGATS